MKISIVSDSHDRADALAQAVREAKAAGAEVCCGHSHRAQARKVAGVNGSATWLVNPGTVAGLAAPATWVLGDLAAMRFDLRELGGSHSTPL